MFFVARLNEMDDKVRGELTITILENTDKFSVVKSVSGFRLGILATEEERFCDNRLRTEHRSYYAPGEAWLYSL